MNKPKETSADLEMASASGIAIKHEIKEEFIEGDNFMAYDDLEVKKESTSTDEEDYFDGADQVEMKFEAEDESLLDIRIKSEEINKEIVSEIKKNPISKDRLFQCDICPKNYKKMYKLTEHKKFIHRKDELEEFKCSICNYATVRKHNFKQHLKIHDKSSYLKCHLCQYQNVRMQNLKAHILSNHNLQNTGEDNVETTGIDKNHEFEGNCFRCKICPDKKYRRKGGLLQHIKFVHKNHDLTQFKCSQCDFTTLKNNHYIQHLKIHDKKNHFKCQFCQYSSALSKSLNAHIFSKHRLENTGENKIELTGKVYECTKCPYSTLIKYHFNTHMKACLKLKNDKSYECHLCEYKTIHKNHLTIHIRSHNEIKKLKCLFCSFQTKIKNNLDRHILAKHFELLNESNKNIITSQSHHCQQCKYITLNRCDLIAHLKTHSVEMSNTTENSDLNEPNKIL
ncbi:unnamed protein product [Brassicogethes aeneus]|uniref:C2H2-type domain-containing protein n=1 Tax=Brassicogethes aeneus TaxID=1431903 RepID=A0A9P0AW22_BRAAE|nr:unnamed protein product [Brassicogethes aeneus]